MAEIETPNMGEILKEEFMAPLGISAYRLSKDIGVTSSRIQRLLGGHGRIDANLSIRLGRYFGVHEGFFMRLQNDIDIRNAKHILGEGLLLIWPIQT